MTERQPRFVTSAFSVGPSPVGTSCANYEMNAMDNSDAAIAGHFGDATREAGVPRQPQQRRWTMTVLQTKRRGFVPANRMPAFERPPSIDVARDDHSANGFDTGRRLLGVALVSPQRDPLPLRIAAKSRSDMISMNLGMRAVST